MSWLQTLSTSLTRNLT